MYIIIVYIYNVHPTRLGCFRRTLSNDQTTLLFKKKKKIEDKIYELETNASIFAE